jgi:GcrA cell cycle regulator
MRGTPWTVESIELVRKLWADGETAAAIAVRLGGISRSAVMGKVFRLRLRTGDGSDASKAKRNIAANDLGEMNTVPVRRRGGGRKKQPQPLATAATQYKTLLELTNNTCRWPHGRPGTNRFFFCGAPEADLERGIPYCARHMGRAYRGSAIVAEGGSAAPSGARPPPSTPSKFGQRPFLVISRERGRPRQV